MQIHVARNGQQSGPFSLEEVNRQLAAGTISPTDLAWYEGAPAWMPLADAPGVIVAAPSTSAAVPTPGPTAATTPPLAATGGLSGPASTTAPSVGGLPLADVWIRLGAVILDGLMIGIPLYLLRLLIVGVVLHGSGSALGTGFVAIVLTVLSAVVFIAYEAYFVSSDKQATLGKQICHLKVMTATGGRLSMQEGAIRGAVKYIGSLVSFLPCLGLLIALGVPVTSFVTVLTTPQRQALHDMAAKTVVVKAG